MQYLATHVRQTKHDLDTAMLVRGNDAFKNFELDIPASGDLETAALARHAELGARYKAIARTA